jgi:hypothetical protein
MTTPIINHPPSVTIPAQSIAIPGLSITDAFAASNPGTMSVTVGCSSGTLSMLLGGVYVPGSFTKTIVLQLSLADANIALATLIYKCPSGLLTDTLTVSVWDQAGANATSTIPILVSAPPVVGTMATRARTLTSMFAINTHIDFGPPGITPQYGDFVKLSGNLNYIWSNSGVAPLLRDWAGNTSDTTWWPQIAAATHNAKFIASIGETDPASYQGYVDRALTVKSLLAYLDGPNEEDSASTNGQTTLDAVSSLNAAAAYMPTLWQIAQQNGLKLINMSYGQGWGSAYDPNFQHGYYGINGDLGAYCTYGNAHTYPQNGDPPSYNIPMLNAAATLAASKPVAITEFGYQLGSGGASVPEDVQAKYGLMGLMDAFISGNVLYGWYGLYDDMSGAWGMFNADYTPRKIATAFRNLFIIMADKGATASTFSPGKLAYAITGCSQALFQKSDGSFWLILWNEQKLVGGQNPTVNLLLSVAGTISVFDPMIGTVAIKTATGAVSVAVPAHPIVVKIH